MVRGDAVVQRGKIVGYVELDAQSPCAPFNPYVVIRYVYPGYRDIALEPMRLRLGERLEFEIELNDQDLKRNIYPINVLTYLPEGGGEGQLVSAFWIRSENQELTTNLAETPPIPSINRQLEPTTTDTQATALTTSEEEQKPTVYSETAKEAEVRNDAAMAEAAKQHAARLLQEEERLAQIHQQQQPTETLPTMEDEYTLTDEAKAVSVTAGDPNCTQISGVQLVYDLQRSQQPLYVSWLSPRCCQEEGCEYTIWAGEKPDQLSLMMKGYKPGAKIQELINPDLALNATYYEIVVKTSNGKRKAAYVVGEGAKYGFEEILDYHDQFNAPSSDPIAFEQTIQQPKGGGATAKTASVEWKESAELLTLPTSFNYQSASRPISDFQPCKYKNELHLIADDPIHIGDELTLTYDYDRPGYRYTLYQRPEGQSDWFVAPGTEELQAKAQFDLKAGQYHNGDYLVLLYKMDKGWGCLSEQPTQAFSIEVIE